ncbi:hypothetical protein GCM10023310_02370 [Paenibacillus vulneris]|uniref:Outer membrane protein Omp28 n=1 Tax=Paenibacillus vulneris TaxID=1133364 RepID=A0ABW3UE92_9BACL
MNRITLMIMQLFLMIIASACGSTSSGKAENLKSQSAPFAILPSPSLSAAPSPEPEERKLTPDEEVALAYITDYLNSDDPEGKANYVKQHFAPDMQETALKYASTVTKKDKRFKDPSVKESIQMPVNGVQVTLVLIQGYEDQPCRACNNFKTIKEVILMIADNKMVWGYLKTDDFHERLSFYLLRHQFKTAAGEVPALTLTEGAPEEDQEVGLAYIHDFYNSDDLKGKRAFLFQSIQPSVTSTFYAHTQVATNKNIRLQNAKVAESLQYQLEERRGSLVLLQGECSCDNKELIILVVDAKMAWQYKKLDKLQEDIIYHLIRDKFQSPSPSPS